jgi:N-acetylglucosaminyl-diphospho-decaprenol L-rhamnosyltransferase
MTSVSLLVVNYRSAALALEAIHTARQATSLPLQVIVVDNSVDDREARMFHDHADQVMALAKNAGYARAINAGRRLCDGEVIVVSNPDIRFGPRSIDRLAEAGAPVAGPALFWDDAHQWLLPPSDLHTDSELLDRALASRSSAWARQRDRRRFRARVAFWSLDQPTHVPALSGAVMAIRAEAFDEAGGFDERFPLYFEENDFLRRVQGPVVYVPAAQCRHLYNQSAAGSPEAAAAYAQSEVEYLRKWSGAAGLLARRLERPRNVGPVPAASDSMVVDGEDVVIEASPLPTFETAAGHFPRERRVEVPPEVWSAYRGETLYLRAVERATGEVVAAWRETRIRA